MKVAMSKRRNSQRSILSSVDEKRSRRWSRCFALRTIRKFASVAGFCCQASLDEKCTTECSQTEHIPLRRASNGLAFEAGGSVAEFPRFVRSANLVSSRCDTQLVHDNDSSKQSQRTDLPSEQAFSRCVTDDRKLRQLLTNVVQRINYLLALGQGAEVVCPNSNCSSDSVSTISADFTQDGSKQFNVSWDSYTSTLHVSLQPTNARSVPAWSPGSLGNYVDPCSRQCRGGRFSRRSTLQSQVSEDSLIPHRRLSARYSADSGFFSTCHIATKYLSK